MSSEAEELREVLKAVTEFIEGIKGPIKELVSMVLEELGGEKLGRDVAAFYKSLVDSGVPEDMAREMTMQYFRERISAVPSIAKLLEMLSSRGRVHVDRGRVAEKLREVAERLPEEKRRRIEEIAGALERGGEKGSD